MQTLWQDVRFGARMLFRNRALTVVSVLTLGLGIGANAAIFSLLNTLFYRPLHVADPDSLVHVYETRQDRADLFPLSYPDFLYYRDHVETLSGLVSHYASAPINLATGTTSREISGSVVTGGFFELLGIRPELGRFFRPDEHEVWARDPVAVISHDLWMRQFEQDPGILTRTIRLNGVSFTVIGVAPAEFHGVFFGGLETDVWIPSSMFHVGYRYCDVSDRDCHILSSLVGRLKTGRTIAESQRELSVLAAQLRSAYPTTNAGLDVLVTSARGVAPRLREESEGTLTLLSGAVLIVLLIACANVAGLLLARGLQRRSEMAIRLAVGAPRRRIVQQLLTESLILALVGGAAGLLVLFWGKELLLAYYVVNSEGQRTYFTLDPDWRVVVFTVSLSLVTGLMFGVVPALQATRGDLLPSLRKDVAGSALAVRLRNGLVIAQVALSMVLMVGAGLMVRSLASIYRGPGYDPSHIVLLRLRPALIGQTPARAKAFQAEVIRKLDSLADVVSASPAFFPPLPGWDNNTRPVWLPGEEPTTENSALQASHNIVGPRYFETLGIPMLAGRDFDDRDRRGSPTVVIVDETLARRFWPDSDAIGQTLIVRGTRSQIVGVVRAAQYLSGDKPSRPFVYEDFWQRPDIDTAPIDSRTHVRVRGDAATALASIRREIAAVDPDVPISEDRPLTEWLDYTFRTARAVRTLAVCFGVLALFLSAVGLYGVLSSAVGQQTREIGIRIALGADGRRVASAVVGHAMTLALSGCVIGILSALATGRLLANFLYGVSRHDLATIVAACATLLGVALAASMIPARRAATVDPMTTLRQE